MLRSSAQDAGTGGTALNKDAASGTVGGKGDRAAGQKRKALQAIDPNSERQLRSKPSTRGSDKNAVGSKAVVKETSKGRNAKKEGKEEPAVQGPSPNIDPNSDALLASKESIGMPDALETLSVGSSSSSHATADNVDGAQAESADEIKLALSGSNSPSVDADAQDATRFDIDSGDRNDQFAVTEYTKEIYSFLKARESASMVAPDYMSRQNDINHKMRVILTDWLVEVHLKFNLRHETLFLCFQLMDRFLQDNLVVRNKLQLVGVTAMMLASKYEDIYPPEMRDFVYICDHAYERSEILEMEQLMLEKLGFLLSLPTPWSFMTRFSKAAGHHAEKKFCHMVSYCVEISQIEYTMLKYPPSVLAAAGVAIANASLHSNNAVWTDSLRHHTDYALADLKPCVLDMLELISSAHTTKDETAPRFKAVFKKFSHEKFGQVTELPMSHVRTDVEEACGGEQGQAPAS